MSNLSGQTYIVTGGASGLGEATCRLLIKQGANVALLDRDDDRGVELAGQLGAKCAFFLMDATDEAGIKTAIDGAFSKFGNIRGLVACAGVGAATTLVGKRGTHDSGIFDTVLKINLYGVFNACKFAAGYMIKNTPDAHGLRGVIINCSSVAGYEGQKGQVAYAASKGAVISMTLPMARDLGSYGVRVNCICPGIMDTPLMASAREEVRKGLAMSVVAPKRLGLPSEFAHLVGAIIDNTYLNGEIIRLDGGIRMAYSSKL